MISSYKQYDLAYSLLSKTLRAFKNHFFMWIFAFSVPIIPFIIFLKDPMPFSFYISSSVGLNLSIFCFMNLATTWYHTHQFSFTGYVAILNRFFTLLIGVFIEVLLSILTASLIRLLSLPIMPFDQLFIGFFAVSLVHGNSLWQSIKQSCSFSIAVPLLACVFFCIHIIRNGLFSPVYLAFHFLAKNNDLTSYLFHWSGYIIIEIFFLLFKVFAYEGVKELLYDKEKNKSNVVVDY